MADSMEVDKQPTPQASGSVAKGKAPAGNKDEPRFVVKKVSVNFVDTTGSLQPSKLIEL